MFINVRLYTDIVSYKVVSVNGNKGTAVSVIKTPNGEIIDNSTPFEITCRSGIWGRWHNCSYVSRRVDDETLEKFLQNKQPNCSYEVEKDEYGTNTVIVTELTAKGKAKRQFEKLGKIEQECRYKYDHRF